ncbi:MAG: riboflavin kinase [Prevotella sp.]|nr:riboflavin kinase [Prevotella sp.]
MYGETLHVSFVSHIRDERRFDSVADLVSQLQADKMLISKQVDE